MPITHSAERAMRKSARRRKANAKKKNNLKTIIKKYVKIAAQNKEEARKQLPLVYKRLDKSTKINLLKKNKASRLKSKLAILVK